MTHCVSRVKQEIISDYFQFWNFHVSKIRNGHKLILFKKEKGKRLNGLTSDSLKQASQISFSQIFPLMQLSC